MKTITTGTTLKGRSICDSECMFSAHVIERKGAFAKVKFQGNEKRVKIHNDGDSEFVFPDGRYSMAPVLRAA